MTLGLWAELMDDKAVEAALPSLGRRGLRLGLALPSERLGDPSFAALTRRAADADVRVRAWPLLPRAQGYWIGEENAAQARQLVSAVVRWTQQPKGPALEGVSIDLEPAYEYAELLRHAGSAKLLRALRAHIQPARFAKAKSELARAVDELKAFGLTAHAVTFPLVLDQPDGDTTLEDALDIPVSGIDWDEVSFMVYQTAFAQLLGSWLGPSLVHSYAESAVARFGDRAGLDLGVVGDHGVGLDPGHRYATPRVLADDSGRRPRRRRVDDARSHLRPGGRARRRRAGALGRRARSPGSRAGKKPRRRRPAQHGAHACHRASRSDGALARGMGQPPRRQGRRFTAEE